MQLVLPVKEEKAPPEFPPDSKTLTPDYKKAQSRSRLCAILQISIYKKTIKSNVMEQKRTNVPPPFRQTRTKLS